jgi:hypothetical protein
MTAGDGAGAPAGRGTAAAAALLAVIGIAVGVLASPFSYDDAWITYRYAANLAAGHGLVYNVGERFFGTTAPGYAVLLGILSLPDPAWVPRVSAVLSVLSLAACGVAFQVFGARRGAPLAGFVAGLLFVVNPLAIETFGGEMVPQAAFALWGLTFVALERPGLAAACGVAATMIRPDGLIALIVILGGAIVSARRVPWRAGLLSGLALALWFGGLYLYFGTPLPDTLAAKQAQRMSGLWRALGTDFTIWVLALTRYPTPYLARLVDGFTTFLALAIFGLLLLPWRRRWWLLAAWPAAVWIAYRQMRLPFYHWYAVPPLVLLAIGAGLAAEGASRAIAWVVARAGGTPAANRGRTIAIAAATIVALASALPMAGHALDIWRSFPGPGERAYIEAGEWLARRTPAEATIGYVEVGFIGYGSGRRIVDPFGLVTPGVGKGIATRDFLYAYRTRRPDFILHHPAFFPKDLGVLVDQPWFKAEYVPIATLDSGRGAPITVFQRVNAPSAEPGAARASAPASPPAPSPR